LALGIASLAFVLDFIPYVGPFFAFIINAIVVLVVSPKWLSLLLSLIIFLTGQGVEQLVAATMASVQFSIPFIVAIALVIFGGVVAGVPGSYSEYLLVPILSICGVSRKRYDCRCGFWAKENWYGTE